MTKPMIAPSIPLLDLHHHLDGSVRLETILDLGLKHNLPLPAKTLEGLRPYVQVSDPQPGVMVFIEKFKWMVGVLVDYDACRRIAFENVEDAASEGIDYIELRYSPWFMAEANALNPQGVVEAVSEGIRAGEQQFGVQVNQIGILSRHYGPQIAFKELDALLSCRDQITALDLAGDEGNFPGEWFVDHFKRGRDAGWHITVHAGEICGPKAVWQAICELGAERIGHAVHAVEDPALMSYLIDHRIGVECCLTSNVQTSTVNNYPDHPLKQFIETGILATINTDDPGISAIDLHYEYNYAAPASGLSEDQIRRAQMNSLEIAFLNEIEKSQLLEKNKSY
jgi:adenosine deaminase